MNNERHLEAALRRLEADYGADAVYDFCSGLHDGVVLGHTSHGDDNPHMPYEPSYVPYRLGAKTAEALRRVLRGPSSTVHAIYEPGTTCQTRNSL